jgi:hypothetical protein
MLYRLSQNLCQNSAKTVQKSQHEQLLVNHVVWPPRFVPNYMDSTKIHSEIYYNNDLNFCANKFVWQPWNACQYSQKSHMLSSSISVHITCCTTSTNLYGMACSSFLSEIRTSLCLGMCALLQQMLSLFSARPLSFSLESHQRSNLSISPQVPCSWHLTKSLLASLLLLSTRMLRLSKNRCAHLP